MTLDDFKKTHDDCYGPGYGGSIQFFAKARDVVPHLIEIARLTMRQLETNQDSGEGSLLRHKIHKELRAIEGVKN